MAQDWTTTALLTSVKRRTMLASANETLSDTDILQIATEEMQTEIMDVLMSVREEYAVQIHDISLQAGVSTYALPPRAVGETLRNVQILSNTDYLPLDRIEPERRHEYTSAQNEPLGYMLQDDSVVIVPTPKSSGTLRLSIHRRPNALVPVASTARVATISGPRTTISDTTVPTALIPTASNVPVDVVDGTPGFRTLAQDFATTTGTNSAQIVLTSALPASVAAGDYVCLAGESCVPQIPAELHPLLYQRTAGKVLEALGDPRMERVLNVYEQMRKRTLEMLTPRSAGSTRYIVNRNGPGFSRLSRRRF